MPNKIDDPEKIDDIVERFVQYGIALEEDIRGSKMPKGAEGTVIVSTAFLGVMARAIKHQPELGENTATYVVNELARMLQAALAEEEERLN